MKIYNKNEENKEEDTWQIFTAQGFTREILAVFWFRKRNIGQLVTKSDSLSSLSL